MEEIWKIYKVTRKGTWEISTYGNVKYNGILYNINKNVKGYLKAGNYHIHRMVAETFIPNPDNKRYVDHIDTNKFNNRVDNLHWVTDSENMLNPITRKENSTRTKIAMNRPEVRKKVSEGCKKAFERPERRANNQKIHIGRIWIHTDTETKQIYPEELNYYFNLGYSKGRGTQRWMIKI